MSPKPFTLTAAIDYANADPHIGHAYEKILADVIARFQRLCGRGVFFMTGVDQHGQKVEQAAARLGMDTQGFVDSVAARFRTLWETLGVAYDCWAATTHPLHQQIVCKVLRQLFSAGDLYKSTYRGFYSVRQEQFLTDKDRDATGKFGPEWGEIIFLEEGNWYFRLSKYLPWLSKFIETHSEFVIPAFRRTEITHAIQHWKQDLCISRPRSRLSWGIELPFDQEFVTYVWFDALISYLSFTGYLSEDPVEEGRFRQRWPALHILGKDIMIPAHAVYWPTMVHAMGFSDQQIPQLLVHGWWNFDGTKVSKSTGNTVDPFILASRYGPAALRYYLMRDISTGRDANFSEERLILLCNTELANGLGNLLNRTLSMVNLYLGGSLHPGFYSHDTNTIREQNRRSTSEYFLRMQSFEIDRAIMAIMDIVSRSNAFIEASSPWELYRKPKQRAKLAEVLATLHESIRLAASLLAPILPKESAAMLNQLGIEAIDFSHPDPTLRTSLAVSPPQPVFPKFP
ncbi:Methionine--tRNA ligase [Candidatus Xiphinematobacter sp. Idaho Grape]|uniref:methionine--tRNA ligase n=1 Tax=Candidatus Xiphinematobacter sp. Idaho Grape TaxID=1704307 RepID=UPI000705CA58|nr:methionine--tRNA ligase [Candidatus Xiphinematobacter sp. Idaho Grape]ALJ56413.1 Methionine--tRNA ligase [Candidatus Xiphinematobacter sp. Idaho Grape]